PRPLRPGADAGGPVHARRHRAGGADPTRPPRPVAGPSANWRGPAMTRLASASEGASASEATVASEGGAPDSEGILFAAASLHKSFGGVHAVRDVSVKIPASGVFAIIGPNGAGKSTLLNLMSGLYQPDAGTMRFDGVDLVGLPAHRRVRLGLA